MRKVPGSIASAVSWCQPIIDRDSSGRRAKWRVSREAVITPRYRQALIRRDEIINLRYLDHPQESDATPRVPYVYVQTPAASIRRREARPRRRR